LSGSTDVAVALSETVASLVGSEKKHFASKMTLLLETKFINK